VSSGIIIAFCTRPNALALNLIDSAGVDFLKGMMDLCYITSIERYISLKFLGF